MATKKSKGQTTALATYDEELAKLAKEASGQEAGVGGGSFFSIRNNTLMFNDSPVPGNEMLVVVADSVNENVYYTESFDADSPSTPACYAFGRDADTMGPHADVDDPQAERCADCSMNEWGSADVGRGKACGNRRRLALIQAGTITKNGDYELETDADVLAQEELCFMRLPPTSLKSWAGYVKKLDGTLSRPPFAVVTRIAVVPDSKTQFKVTFELVDKVSDQLIPTLMERHKEARTAIEFPYAKIEADPTPKKGRGRGKAKSPSKKATRRVRANKKF